MSQRKQSRYATKRKLRLVPTAFSEPCNDLLSAIRQGAKEDRLNELRDRFARQCARDEGGPLWA